MVEKRNYYNPPLARKQESNGFTADLLEEISKNVKVHISQCELLPDQVETIAHDYVAYLGDSSSSFPLDPISEQFSLEHFLAKNVALRVVVHDPRYNNPTNDPTVQISLSNNQPPRDSNYDPLINLHNSSLTQQYTNNILSRAELRDLTHHYLDKNKTFEQYDLFK